MLRVEVPHRLATLARREGLTVEGTTVVIDELDVPDAVDDLQARAVLAPQRDRSPLWRLAQALERAEGEQQCRR